MSLVQQYLDDNYAFQDELQHMVYQIHDLRFSIEDQDQLDFCDDIEKLLLIV